MYTAIPWNDINVPRFLTLGIAISVAEEALLYPFDTVKTRLQVDTGRADYNALSRLIRETLRTEGARAFYQGFWWNSVASLPSSMLYILTYNGVKENLNKRWNMKSDRIADNVVVPMLAGAFADLAHTALWNPVDVIVQRMQIVRRLKPDAMTLPSNLLPSSSSLPSSSIHSNLTPPLIPSPPQQTQLTPLNLLRPPPQPHLNSTMLPAFPTNGNGNGPSIYRNQRPVSGLHIARKIIKTEGWRGLYRGFFSTILLHTPESSLWWGIYEVSKRLFAPGFLRVPFDGTHEGLQKAQHTSADSAREHALHSFSGLVAGIGASILTNPLDVAKTRIQTQTNNYGTRNPFKVVERIYQNEGFAALTRGVIPRVSYSVPSSTIAAFTYELLLRWSCKSALALEE